MPLLVVRWLLFLIITLHAFNGILYLSFIGVAHSDGMYSI